MKNSPKEYSVLPDGLLHHIARLKGCPAPQQAVPVAASILYPVSAAIAAEERRKEETRRKAMEEALKNPTRAQEIAGHGIFIGTWQPAGLSLKFNVFAAKEDLTDEDGRKKTYIYDDTVKRIAALKKWHGFDGTNYANDKQLYKALKDGSYIKGGSGWFIPPRELLTGTEANGPRGSRQGITQPDNLFDLKDKGALRGTFCKGDVSGLYWSSTEHRDDPSTVWHADFISDSYEYSYSYQDSNDKLNYDLSCRPVRLELAP